MYSKTKPLFTGDIPVSGNKDVGVYFYEQHQTGLTYIGSTINRYGRHIQHTSALARCGHVNRRFQGAYNESPCFEVKFIPLTGESRGREDLLNVRQMEQFFLDTFEDKKKLLNVAVDAINCGGGISPSVETREKIAKAMTGRFVSEETRRRRSESLTGIKHSQSRRDKVSDSRSKYRVKVGDSIFSNTEKAAASLGFANRGSIRFRCLSDAYPDYQFSPKENQLGNNPTI